MVTPMDMGERRYHLRRTEDELLVRRLATIAGQSFAVIEEERARIARELHDELGGVLSVVKMDLAWVLRHLPRDRNDIHERVERASQDVSAIMTAVQRICSDLHPPILDELGLAEALRWQADDFGKRTDIACRVNIGDVPQLKKNVTIALFRFFQEALTNVARHAHATQVFVDLSCVCSSLSCCHRHVSVHP
jgi:two-component system, NarL family, sensor histidine kinase UhpB